MVDNSWEEESCVLEELEEELEEHAKTERKCTNLRAVYFCGGFFVILITLLVYCKSKSAVELKNGYDGCGNICGFNNTKHEDGNCKPKDITSKPKLAIDFLRQIGDEKYFSFACVDRCDANYGEIGNTCIYVSDYAHGQGFFFLSSDEINKKWHDIIFISLLAMLLSYAVLWTFHYAIERLTCMILIAYAGIVVFGCFYFMITANDSEKRVLYCLALIVLIIISYFFVLIIIDNRKQIELVGMIFKEASKALYDVKIILLEPLLIFATSSVAIIIFKHLILMIEISGSSFNVKNNGRKEILIKQNAFIVLARFANIVAFIWCTQFILGCQHFIISGTISK